GALDEEGTVRTHRQGGLQLLARVRGADGRDDDLDVLGVGATTLADAQRLLEGDFIERVDAHLDAVGDDAGAIWFHADADVVVHHALDADKDTFHRGRSFPGSQNETRGRPGR